MLSDFYKSTLSESQHQNSAEKPASWQVKILSVSTIDSFVCYPELTKCLLILPRHSPIMCDWEEFLFTCSHSTVRLKSYCHFARNDPRHQCYSVNVLRDSWEQSVPCGRCATAWMGATGTTPDVQGDGRFMKERNGHDSSEKATCLSFEEH